MNQLRIFLQNIVAQYGQKIFRFFFVGTYTVAARPTHVESFRILGCFQNRIVL